MTVAEAVTLIAAISAAIVSIVGAIAAVFNVSRLGEVHAAVNGQSARLEALNIAKGHAEGVADAASAIRPPAP